LEVELQVTLPGLVSLRVCCSKLGAGSLSLNVCGKGENAMRTVSKVLVVLGLLTGGICAMAGDSLATPIPEPSALLVVGSSLGILGFMLRRKKG
jgi:PEP-CTERM motif